MRFRPLSFYGLLLIPPLLLGGCHTSRTAEPSSANNAASVPTDTSRTAAIPKAQEEATVKIGYMLGRDVEYSIPLPQLLQEFIREFGDGTVIDKVMVTPVQDTPRDKPTYYLVGMGQLNGQFRAMALPLRQTEDKSLYLSPTAARHIAQGFNCSFCYFRFSRGKVTGVDCSETATASADRRCSFRIEPGNHLFSKK